MKRTTIIVVVAISGVCCLGCVVAALIPFRYQPAVVATPGHEIRWPTRPGQWASVVKSYQRFLEIRTCDYTVLGWSGEGVLFYKEACQDASPRVWAYDLGKGDQPYHVEASPLTLLQEAVPRSSILEWARSPAVRPADAEPTVRKLEVRADGLASPDGRWVAVVVRHVYGPEDVIVLEMMTTSVPLTEALPEMPLLTSTIVTPPSAYATQDAARQATIVARATASPFPTSGPSTVQLGEPSVATARRDGLSLEVRLPKDTYLAGEGNRAEVTLRNDSLETVIVQCDREHSSWLVLLDDQGHELAPWPWTPMSGPGWNRCFGKELAPGQVLTDTLTLQIPAAPEGSGQVHALWVETRFSRSSPDTLQGSDNLWLHLAAGPIPLQVIGPEPARRLVADLQADREGWHLRVTGADGQVPPGPLWGSQEITSFSSASAGPLHDSPDGTWSAAWLENEWDEESEICLRTWVAAPGYVTAVVTETVPGTGEARCMSWATEPPLRQTFPSLEAAQATLAYPLYRPSFLPAGAQLEEVRVETMPYEPQGWGDAGQTYRLPDGGWLELSQQATAEPRAVDSFGRGAARYDLEANAVTVGQTTGYTIRRFGWWQLDWKCGDAGLELRAPVGALSLEELAAVATGVRSPDGTCPPAPTPAPSPTAPAPPTATPAD